MSNKQLHDTSNPGSVKPGSLKSARLSRKIIGNSFYHLMFGVTMRVVLKAALRTQSGYKDTKFPCTVLGQQGPNNVQYLDITAFKSSRCLYFVLLQTPLFSFV